MSNGDLEPGLAVVATSVALFLAFLGILTRRSSKPPTPPGPKSSWFGLGRPEIPRISPWRTYMEWGNIYGDMIFYRAYGGPILIINSAKVADDLLDKRGAIYSSRPVRTMTRELMGWRWSLAGMRYGNTWRRYRGLFQKHFHSRATPHYEPIEVKGVQTLLRNLHRAPNEFEHHLRQNAAALVMKISYGHDVAEDGDAYVTLAEKAMWSLTHAGIYGTYLVDYLPILKHVPAWFPGAGFKRKAYEWRELSLAMLERPFEMVKQRMESGTAVPCVTVTELERSLNSVTKTDVKMIQGIAAVSYAAGADTTVAAILTFLLAMTLNLDIQHKAQAEIDGVVGTDRLPTFDDRDQLPFVTRIMWEALRWNPVTPLSVPHATVQDDIYQGYLIPKGTTIQPNVWAMFHDESKYPDSFRFKPDRYEDLKKNAELGINELPIIGFGFGRRVCPGRWLALDNVWITIASILAVYNIVKVKDDNGRVIEPAIEFTTESVSRPKPFECSFTARSDAALALIKQTIDE